jgi:hypothetical protein
MYKLEQDFGVRPGVFGPGLRVKRNALGLLTMAAFAGRGSARGESSKAGMRTSTHVELRARLICLLALYW